ncbi:hypothetical protein FQN60_015447, partial [Etheostoma spectabile]
MRRFALTNLRDFGMGKKASEDKIIEECEHLIEVFKKFKGEAFDTTQPMNYAVSNIICSIVYGSRFEYDDPEFTSLVDRTNMNIQLVGSPSVQVYNMFPWIGKLISVKREVNAIGAANRKQNLRFFSRLKETLNPQMCRGFVDAFLVRKQNLEESGIANSQFNDNNLLHTVLNLFAAGTDTTATTLRWGLLFMAKYPKIQDQVQEEVSREIGSRQVKVEDRKNMPFTDAVIHETQRLANIVPMALPHKTTQDVTFQGHFIKKARLNKTPSGTTVYPLLTSVLYDESEWERPHSFYPAHFLDKDGKFVKRDAFMPFSAGRRICLGESLARMELFIFFTTLLQHFRFTPPPGVSEDELDLTPRVGFTLNPSPHKLLVVLAGYKTVKEALVNYAEEFGERDPMLIMQESNEGHGVLWANGDSWKEMRRFALTNLRDFGMGKKASEDKIIEECDHLIEVFKTFKDQVREELSREIGSRNIQIEDRKNLPFTEAVIHETQRLASILPIAVPHKTSQDITFQGVIWANGDSWKEMRRFALTNLRDFGMGKKASEDKIIEECDYLLKVFKKFKGEAFDSTLHMNYAVSNIICSIVYGSRFEYDDPEFKALIDRTNRYVELVGSPSVQLYNMFPWIGKWFSGKKEIVEIFAANKKQNLQLFSRLKETLNPQMCRGFVDAFLVRKQNLEIGSRQVRAEDRKNMPFTDAVVHETQRLASITPMAVPHKTNKDITFQGHFIKKARLNKTPSSVSPVRGTTVFPLLTSVLHDENQVQEELRREIGSRQVQVEDRKNLPFTDAVVHETQRLASILPTAVAHKTSQDITFQGRRICLGESLARMELFIFFTTLLQHFRFTPPPGVSEDELDLTPRVGFILNPSPHK